MLHATSQCSLASGLAPHIDDMIECLESWAPGSDRRTFHARVDEVLAETWSVVRQGRSGLREDWRTKLHPYFLQAPLIDRAFTKPLGYAGDFELMNLIYRNRPEGPTPLGRALHQWANSFRSSSAVRSRRRWIVQQMQEHAHGHLGPYRVLSLASGPALELCDLVRESFLAERADLLCIDQDQQSLAYAGAVLRCAMDETRRSVPVSLSHDSVKKLLVHRGVGYGPRQFVYAMGLYDYLPERPGRALTSVLYGLLAKGGRLVIGNYAANADAEAFLYIICDWHLIYRTRDQVLGLAADLPGEARSKVLRDSTGCVYFLVVDKS